MFRVIIASFFILLANTQPALAKKAERPTLASLKPYSLTLESDVDSCRQFGCLPLIGITTETLVLSNLEEKLPITLNFENCKMSFDAWKYRVKDDYLLITSGDNTPVKIDCDGRTTTYPNASFFRRNGEYGIKLRKMDNGYSHLGKLSIGVMFMPVKD
tara:strand:- start:27588 stop:28061 length:474 start_codon:yes stop_codon:yes gene_type:complete